ncbi:sigma-54-dependent Fis family transcriptional regulator [Methylocystis sp.]|uniref:sigma-54-dependent Fis family transcriptional regulator n=1 Tax=Methylocystis sp. TaxID=1911079 RepID=UPI003DA41B5E
MGHMMRGGAVAAFVCDVEKRPPEVFELERPSVAWDWMRQTGQAPQGADWVRPQVLQAWARCIDEHDLPPGSDFAPRMPMHAQVCRTEHAEQNLRDAFAAGLPLMVYNLRPFLEEGNVTILLTDPQGHVVHLLGAGLRIMSAGQNLARIGVGWHEASIGNNGVGTACLLDEPVAFEGKEHFSRALHSFATAGCPIFGSDGRVCATIGMLTDRRDAAKLMLGFLRITCQLFEARLFERFCTEGYLLRLRHRNGSDTLAEQSTLIDGKILVSPNGVIKGANRSTVDLLGANSVASIIGKAVGDVIGVSIAEIVGKSDTAGVRHLTVGRTQQHIRLEALRLDGAAQETQTPCAIQETSRAEPWRDHVLEAALQKASVLQQRDISLLITGESGVGKDHLVRRLHANGPRMDKPIIAINCAAIPRDLIESELFGYEGGSFTGARAKGKKGKFVEADGGVLFLDEIGDMALDLQATLLRVLDSSEVVPIGSHRPIKVDVRVIAATNCPLREMVKEGKFRRDLYYRLNGVQIWLPPLRERPDRMDLIEHLLACEQEGQAERKVLSDDVRALFFRHPWPGNIREARNVLRSSLAVAGRNVIRLNDLPHDFIEEAEAEAPHCVRNAPVCGADPVSTSKAGKTALADWEEQAVRAALAECEGNVAKAARRLEITRATLYHKMDRYGMRGAHRIAVKRLSNESRRP